MYVSLFAKITEALRTTKKEASCLNEQVQGDTAHQLSSLEQHTDLGLVVLGPRLQARAGCVWKSLHFLPCGETRCNTMAGRCPSWDTRRSAKHHQHRAKGRQTQQTPVESRTQRWTLMVKGPNRDHQHGRSSSSETEQLHSLGDERKREYASIINRFCRCNASWTTKKCKTNRELRHNTASAVTANIGLFHTRMLHPMRKLSAMPR